MSLFATQPPSTGAPFGLRQRRVDEKVDENANPNNAVKFEPNKPKVRPPPRQFLATMGKSALRTTAAPPPAPKEEEEQRALIPLQPKTDESSLWVLAHGHRTPAHLRSLLRRLESCGSIAQTRRGDAQSNWIAVRYSSELAAHKAVCRDGEIMNVGGSTVVIGVKSFVESDAAARLGIDIYGGEDAGLLRGYGGGGVHEMICADDTEVLLDEAEEERYGIDSVCGRVLAWFFNW